MFFNRKRPLTELLQGITDCHSHILPNVDDGIRTDEEALATLAHFEQLGIQKVIMTPHIMEEYPHNNATTLRATFERFCQLYSGNITLTLGAEYMLDNEFQSHLKSGDLLTLWDNHLLVETSYLEAPVNLKAILREIMTGGYFVVLAHPERYLYMNTEMYKELKEMGVLFQLNLLSTIGGYGKTVQKRAEMLLKMGYYDYQGSDLHNLKSFIRLTEKVRINPKQLVR